MLSLFFYFVFVLPHETLNYIPSTLVTFVSPAQCLASIGCLINICWMNWKNAWIERSGEPLQVNGGYLSFLGIWTQVPTRGTYTHRRRDRARDFIYNIYSCGECYAFARMCLLPEMRFLYPILKHASAKRGSSKSLMADFCVMRHQVTERLRKGTRKQLLWSRSSAY